MGHRLPCEMKIIEFLEVRNKGKIKDLELSQKFLDLALKLWPII